MATDINHVFIKWNGKEICFNNLVDFHTVLDLKEAIQKETGVQVSRQKLLGLKAKGGKVVADTLPLCELLLKPKQKILMMGSTDEAVAKINEVPEEAANVVNDLDIEDEEIEIKDRAEYLNKVERRVKEYKVAELNPPREGKHLLVLDIDYTLFDHRSSAERGVELMRPYLHEFLTSAYQDYDIVIWSATSMKWIEEKMKLLGVSTNPQYKICFYLDSAAMITVISPHYGIVEVKPLGVIWGKYPEKWSERNTIMFDDIRRNFIMNPRNGLKIRPFKHAHQNRETDDELVKLTKYLRYIAPLPSFSHLDHRKWESYHPHAASQDTACSSSSSKRRRDGEPPQDGKGDGSSDNTS